MTIQSGCEHGVTLGTPIGLLVHNKDQRPHDYAETDLFPRPSHADYTYLAKYGLKASSGGGRASARETIGRVAAGAIAEKYLKEAYGVEIVAFVASAGKICLPFVEKEDEVLGKEYMNLISTITREEVDKEITRCPHRETSQQMEAVSWPVTVEEHNSRQGYPRGQGQQRLHGRHRCLRHSTLPARTR